MPMREWYIYSRPWSSAGSNCMHSSGMASVDMIDSFLDQYTLSQYSLKEFTLHAHGQIEINNITQQQSTTLLNIDTTHYTWSTHDMTNVYNHLSTRGYQYGSSFQKMQSLHGTASSVVTQLSNDLSLINDLSSYRLLHRMLTLIPGFDKTFIPISAQKMIVNKGKANLSYANLEVRGKYHDNISCLGPEGTYTCGLLILSIDSKTKEPIFTFESVTLQQIPSEQSDRWTLEKSIFDKLNITVNLPNVDHREHVDSLLKDYCIKQVWNDLFPSLEKILNSQIDTVNNQDLVESIDPFKELAAYYTQQSLKELDLSLVDDQYRPLLNACHFLTSFSSEQVTWHSILLRLMQLFNRFPSLEPILTLLNAYGSRLKAIFTGQQSGLNVFLGNDDTGRILQQVKNIMGENKTQMIFDATGQHLRIELRRNSYDSLSRYRLRICWFASSECSDVLPVLDLLLHLSHYTNLWIDFHHANMDTTQTVQAEQIFETRLADQTRLSITYDQTLVRILIESFDIIFCCKSTSKK
ncbi:unnamed protein product [Adineta steineri]|uniref:Uncharacterized protein n=1 Tax=Adineta steineri TaxID=433720 RepID=A0A819RQ35_9BILA|nr:unnamed protein product [Adineta steineri]CAF4056352.1 unnamed protein product [Adineta steineri]